MADAMVDREGRMFGEDAGAAVAGFRGAVPVPVVARQPFEVDGGRIDFGFLGSRKSGCSARTNSGRPLPMTERRPLTFQVINFMRRRRRGRLADARQG